MVSHARSMTYAFILIALFTLQFIHAKIANYLITARKELRTTHDARLTTHGTRGQASRNHAVRDFSEGA